MDLQQLWQSENPLEKSTAEIMVMLQEILEIVRGQKRLQVHKNRLREFIVENSIQEKILRAALEPNAALKEGLRRMQESSDQAKGLLSSDAEKWLKDKKKLKGSRDEGEEDET